MPSTLAPESCVWQRVPMLHGGPIQALLTLGDVHFASATEAAQRDGSRESVLELYHQAEESFKMALRAAAKSPPHSPIARRTSRETSPTAKQSTPAASSRKLPEPKLPEQKASPVGAIGDPASAFSFTYMRATVGLAKVALARGEEKRCVELLDELPDTEP